MTPTHEAPVHPDPDANARFVLGNIATNGRAFALSVAAMNALAFYMECGNGFAVLALLALASLAIAVLVDQIKPSPLRPLLGIVSYALPAFAAIGFPVILLNSVSF